jgi:hypothetical protein
MRGKVRRASAVIGAAAIGSLLYADAAGAETTEQFTFTHTSGQRVTCSIAMDSFFFGGEPGHVGAFTRIESTDPRCAASVSVSLAFTDTSGNEQGSSASASQHVFMNVQHVDEATSGHEAFFTQCTTTNSNPCWTGYQLHTK